MTDFPTTDWPQEYADQVEYIENLLHFVEAIDVRSLTVGVYQATEPTAEEFMAAWEREVGEGIPLEVGARFFWWDTVRDVLDMAYLPTFDAGEAVSTLTIFPMFRKRKQLDIVVLGHDILEADAAAPWVLIPTVDQSYSHLLTFFDLRGGAAAASTPFGLQGPATTGYFYESATMNGSAAAPVATSVLAAQADFRGAQAIAANTANRYCYSFGFCLMAGYSVGTRDLNAQTIHTAFLGAAPIAAGSRLLSAVFSSVNNPAAATILRANITTSARQGSKFVAFGLR